MAPPAAAISGVLVTIATQVIRALGYAGIGLLVASSGVIGLPGTELPMLFAGFTVEQGHLVLAGVVLAGVLGDVIGAAGAYVIGRFASQELIARHGARLHLAPHDLARAHGWFERYGSGTILVSRCLPVVRAAFPFAAGVARMSLWRFALMSTIGSIIWIGGLALLGQAVGHQWQTWRHHLDVVDYAGVVIVALLLGAAGVRWWRRARHRTTERPPAPEEAATAAELTRGP